MMLALAWLTVSLPYVNETQQVAKKIAAHASPTGNNSPDNSLAGTTEEKTSSTNTLSEEYLHDHEEQICFSEDKLDHSNYHSYDVYVAFHGELISPPPEV